MRSHLNGVGNPDVSEPLEISRISSESDIPPREAGVSAAGYYQLDEAFRQSRHGLSGESMPRFFHLTAT